jgi:hypothetical protein
MKIFCLLIALFCSINMFGQIPYRPIPYSGANFSIHKKSAIDGGQSHPTNYIFINDTIIYSKVYAQFKVYEYNYNMPLVTYEKFFRNDSLNKIVYTFNVLNAVEDTFYNFNLQIGNYTKWKGEYYKLTTKDSVMISGNWYLRNYFTDSSSAFNHLELIEGMGFVDGFKFEYGENLYSFCLKNNQVFPDTALFFDSAYCYISVGINNKPTNNNLLQFSMNQGQLYVQNFTGYVSMYNTQGQLLFSDKINNYLHKDVFNFVEGIYFLEFLNEKNRIVKKIKINNFY